MDTRALGSVPSPIDYRDQLAAKAVYDAMAGVANLPPSFLTDLTALGEVLDQNKVPACVSHAWALVMKYWWYKTHGEIVNFSPRFLDIMSAQPDIPWDGGRVPRNVCKVSYNFGCCTEALLPNETANRPGESDAQAILRYRGATITQVMKDEAAKYKIPGYIRVNDAVVSDFRTAVYQFGLVSGLFSIGSEWWTPSWLPKDILPLRTPAQPVGGHQIVVHGWQDALINVLRNSWSKLWGLLGDGTYNAQSWLPWVWEGWAIAVVPKDIGAWLSNLPKQADFHYQWNTDMQRGQSSDDIKMAQVALLILGFLEPVAPVDLGIYGPKTSKAVLKYQSARGISPTAPDSIGPRTRADLNKDFAL